MAKNLKTYYTVHEVAAIIGVTPATIRYWEKTFTQLKPRVDRYGKGSMYTEKDIEEVKRIHSLVKVRGFRIAAAQKVLKKDGDKAEQIAVALNTLTSIKDELDEMVKHLEGLE